MNRHRYNQMIANGAEHQVCTHSVHNNSICRRCGKFHDRVRQPGSRNRYVQRNQAVYGGRSRAREREKKELEAALVDIAVQESLEMVEEESRSRSPQKIMRKPIRNNGLIDYEMYGSQIGTSYSDLNSNAESEEEPVVDSVQSIDSRFSRPKHFSPYVPNTDNGAGNARKKMPERTVRISTRRFDDYDTDQSLDVGRKDDSQITDTVNTDNMNTNSQDIISRDDSTLDRINNSFIEMTDRNTELISRDEEFVSQDEEGNFDTPSRLNIVVGRGRRDIEGGMNFPLNPAIEVCPYLMYVDQNEGPDPDVQTKIEDLKLEEIGLSPEITDLRVYFDWSSFYCTAMQGIVRFMNRVKSTMGLPITIYVPLYTDDKSLPGDVKRNIVDSPENRGDTRVMIVYGAYPMFDWHDLARISEIRQHVNPEMFIMITNHDL